MHVGICRLTLISSHSHSLKEKRAVVRKLKDRVRSRFQVPLTEVASQDTWQRIVLGFAIVGSDRQYVDGKLAEIARYITGLGEREGVAQLADDEREILSYGNEPINEARSSTAPLDDSGWIPESWRSELDD
ncbi:MAG: DUF503 domain-containing protein [Proteobacteria bacterium]|nr:DUF503 domain-containing protein [Pseudomonadota bacterium]